MIAFWWIIWIATVVGSPVTAVVLGAQIAPRSNDDAIKVGAAILIAGIIVQVIASNRIANLTFERSQKKEGWSDPQQDYWVDCELNWKKSRRLLLLLLFGGWFVMFGIFFFGCMGAMTKGL